MAGYPRLYLPDHPRANSKGCVSAHVALAERAFGRPLPPGVQVHHVGGNKRNSVPDNLVICQDAAYHKLLHVRTVVVRMGGNPDADRMCSKCRRLKPFADFHRSASNQATGLQTACRACQLEYGRFYKQRRAA